MGLDFKRRKEKKRFRSLMKEGEGWV